MSPTDGSIEAPSLLRAVERALIRIPRSSHHGLTKTPTAIRIAGRTYLDLARLGNIAAVQAPEVVLAARLYHLAYTHRSMAVTGQCALWATGRASDPPVPPITIATPKPTRPIKLPAVTIGSHRFPPVTVKPRHVHLSTHVADARGLLIENLESAQVTVARTSNNPRAAFTQLCMIGHVYTHFDNFHLPVSRGNEEAWKFLLERELKALGNRAHGRAQARWIIDHVDAGCASPGEARLLYELCVAGLTGMQTQVEVHTHGHRYFIDCAFLAERIGIEFDGRAKYGETPSSIHASLARERERQRHLEAEGWHIIRVGWRDLEHPAELIAQIRAARRPPGVSDGPSTAANPRQRGVYYHRRPTTACRRRVTPLWSQFPPRPHPQPPATRPQQAHPRAHSRPSHDQTQPPTHANGGFYYHRRPATACRRRVTALWSQFPPHTHPQPPTTPPTAGPATTEHNRQPRAHPQPPATTSPL